MSLPSPSTRRRCCAALLGAAFVVHGLLAWLEWRPSPRLRVGDELRYLERAHQIAAGNAPSPDLLWPPLYAYFLAPFTHLGGAERVATVLAQLLLLAGSALLLRDLARRWAGPGLHADLAAFLLFASPPLAAHAYYLWPEVLHLALFLASLWILAARRDAWRWQLALGLLLGLALLTKSLLTAFLPVLLAPLLVLRPLRRGLLGVAIVLAAGLATVLPTVASHGRQTGSWVIADSSRFNLWVGLNDPHRDVPNDRRLAQAHAEFEASGSIHAERNRETTLKIAGQLGEHGWLNTLIGQIQKQPGRLLSRHSAFTDQLAGGRLAQRGRGYQAGPGAFTLGLRWASWALHALVLALAPLGFLLRPPSGRAWCWLPLAFLAYNALLFLGLHVTSRYLFQLLPVLLLGASATAAALLRDRPSLAKLDRRHLAAALLAGAALVASSF